MNELNKEIKTSSKSSEEMDKWRYKTDKRTIRNFYFMTLDAISTIDFAKSWDLPEEDKKLLKIDAASALEEAHEVLTLMQMFFKTEFNIQAL